MQLRHQDWSFASALFPGGGERQELDDFLTRRLAEADLKVRQGSVTPTIDIDVFRRELTEFDFAEPRELRQTLCWVVSQMEKGLVHLTHPRYFGLFNPKPSFPAQCADRIAGLFNPQLATWTTSPAAVEIEAHVARSVLARMGFPPGAVGHFTSGGSEANYTALLCALVRSNPQFADEGARAFKGRPVFYVSRECHVAWIKIALQAGIGHSAVRLIATDGSGRMDPAALTAKISSDLAEGCTPVMLAATAGTTNAGMIDPLIACASIAKQFGLFYHVDAAWGGALIASDKLRGELAGIELADSTTVDAHKWFATTMGCGMFFTRHADVLATAFQTTASYMPSKNISLDPYVTTAQWSRRFLGLRLFLSLAAAGWDGYAKHVERGVELSALLAQQLVARGWSIANASKVAVLCVAPPSGRGDVASIVKRVVGSGAGWVSLATFEGQPYVRICITHGETMPQDVAMLVDSLDSPISR